MKNRKLKDKPKRVSIKIVRISEETESRGKGSTTTKFWFLISELKIINCQIERVLLRTPARWMKLGP